ncbi:MAG: vWA domain-containing protein [Pseudomonadota bacterium]
MRVVAKDFVDQLDSFRDSKNTIKIGVVPFNKYVNIGDHNKFEFWVEEVANPEDWKPCVGSRPEPATLIDGLTYETVGGATTVVQFPAVEYSSCPSPIVELTDSMTDLHDGIALMEANGSTYIGAGVAWGQRMLSKEAPLTLAESFGSLDAGVNHEKVMLVLTDGDNFSGPSFPRHDAGAGTGNNYTNRACENARAAGITVYSIVFGTNVSGDGKSIMSGCAGGTSGYFEAANATALKGAFDEILSKLVSLRLSS